MKTQRGLFKLAAIAVAVLGLAAIAQPAQAQLVTYNQGDLLLGFRKAGVTEDVVINIGQAANYRTATADFSVSVGNLGSLLSDTFGATWHDDPGLQWAVIGNPSASSAFNGDPAGAFYVTKEQTTVDTQSQTYSILTGVRPVVRTGMQTLQGRFDDQLAASGNAFATIWSNTTASGTDLDWTDAMTGSGYSGLAFGAFSPSEIQGADATGITHPGNALDLYRVLQGANNTTGVSYEGTFRIDNSGAVTFGVTPGVGVVPEPSRALLLAFGLALPLLRRRRSSVSGVPAIA
jgi:hypothetical protein